MEALGPGRHNPNELALRHLEPGPHFFNSCCVARRGPAPEGTVGGIIGGKERAAPKGTTIRCRKAFAISVENGRDSFLLAASVRFVLTPSTGQFPMGPQQLIGYLWSHADDQSGFSVNITSTGIRRTPR
jgi:hypothetical protein